MQYEIISGEWVLDTVVDPISVTYKIDDILDPTTKDASYTKTLLLPGTPNNNRYFGHLFDVNIDTSRFNPRISQPAIIQQGGSQIIKGRLQLIEIIKQDGDVTWSCQVVSELASLITQVKDLTLANLDMSHLDHIRNKANIQASWDNLGDGYLYPYIVNGNRMEKWTSETSIYDLYPSFFVKEIIDKIFEGTDFKWESRFFNSEYFKRLILPYTEDGILLSDAEVALRTTQVSDSSSWVGPNGTTYAGWREFTPGTPGTLTKGNNRSFSGFKMNLESGSSATFDWGDPGNSFDGTQYQVPSNGFYTLDIRQNIHFAYWSASNTYIWAGYPYAFRLTYKIEVVRPDSTVRTTLFSVSDQAITPSALLDTTRTGLFIDTQNNIGDQVQWAASDVWLNEGETIKVSGFFKWPDSQNNYFGGNGSDSVIQIYPIMQGITGSESSRFICKPSSNVGKGNEDILANNLLSNTIKQDEFLLDILKAFNLVVNPHPLEEGVLQIEPDEDFFQSGGKVHNWDDLLDEGSEVKITPMSTLDWARWKWKWSDDDDYYNKNYLEETKKSYGECTVAIQNDWSNEEELLELGFASTPNAQEWINGRVAPHFVDREGVEVSPKKVKPRILFWGGLLPSEPWLLKDNYDQDPAEVELTHYPYVGMWDHPTQPRWTLEFARSQKQYWETSAAPNNNLFWQFHRYRFWRVRDEGARLLEGFFHLGEKFISNLDFRDKIFLDGAYWRINTINDYDPTVPGLTKVVLYKLIDFEVSDTLQTRTTTSPQCPVDIVAKKGKDGKWFHWSPSGAPVSQGCCDSLGGNWANGVCYLPTPSGTTGPYVENPSVGLGGVTLTPTSDPSGTLLSKKNENTILTPNILVKGSGNWVPSGADNSIIIGDNNKILEGVTGSLLVGDNKVGTKTNQLVIDYLLDKTAQTIRNTEVVDSHETFKNMAYREALVPYTDYLIDDIGIIATAISTKAIAPTSLRIQEVVSQTWYITSSTNKGVWKSAGIVYSINDTVVFGGKVWKNNTGYVGSATGVTTLDAYNWTETTATYKEPKIFVVKWDLWTDQIWEQWDERANVVKVEDGDTRGYTDITDWLQPGVYNNTTFGIINNSIDEIYDNHVSGPIYNNRNTGIIYANRNLGEISGNSNTGSIFNNTTSTGQIKNNASSGDIKDTIANK